MKYLKEEYFRYKSARYKRGQHFAGKVVLESPFTVKYPKYCEKGRLEYISFYALTEFICLALKHYPMIALGIAAQAFAGLRKGEVTNMSWNNIQWLYMHNELRRFSINLKIKHQLRSDGLDVGQIKSHDVAQVHPMFMEYFDLIFREHQNYLQKIFKKKNKYGALFMNRNGEAMTDRSYEYSFNELVDMLIEHLLKTGHPRAISEANMMLEKRFTTHTLRFFFSQYIASLPSANVFEIAMFRRDKSLDSAMTYIRHNPYLIDNKIKEMQRSI